MREGKKNKTNIFMLFQTDWIQQVQRILGVYWDCREEIREVLDYSGSVVEKSNEIGILDLVEKSFGLGKGVENLTGKYISSPQYII